MSESTKVELLANRQWEGVVAKVEAERDKLRAELAAAQRELAALRQAILERAGKLMASRVPSDLTIADAIEMRAAELLAQDKKEN